MADDKEMEPLQDQQIQQDKLQKLRLLMAQLAQLNEIQKVKAAQEAEDMKHLDDSVRIMIAPCCGQMRCSVAIDRELASTK